MLSFYTYDEQLAISTLFPHASPKPADPATAVLFFLFFCFSKMAVLTLQAIA